LFSRFPTFSITTLYFSGGLVHQSRRGTIILPVGIFAAFTCLFVVFLSLLRKIGPAWGVIAAVALVLVFLWLFLHFWKILRNYQQLSEGLIPSMQGFTIGSGDLTLRLNFDVGLEAGDLAGSYDRFLEALRVIIGKAKYVAGTLHKTSEHLSSLSEEISAATEQVTANVSSVATNAEQQKEHTVKSAKSIQEQAVSLKEFLSNLDEAINMARLTHTTAEHSSEIIRAAIEKISSLFGIFDQNVKQVQELSGTIQEIDQVLEVITQIADQTNLLALNAAIEAARAGEAGRGFAVVADEIRKLAEESGKATQQIGALVQRIQTENRATVDFMVDGTKNVTSGREAMTESERSLNSIVDSVVKLEKRVSSMSTLSQSQLVRTETMHSDMQQVISFAEDNASALEEIVASMEELNNSMVSMTSSIQDVATSSLTLDENTKNMKTE
jgi:methyl-accepting chemotaxis protein